MKAKRSSAERDEVLVAQLQQLGDRNARMLMDVEHRAVRVRLQKFAHFHKIAVLHFLTLLAIGRILTYHQAAALIAIC